MVTQLQSNNTWISIYDTRGNQIYWEHLSGYWEKRIYNDHLQVYFEDSTGYIDER